MKKLKLLRESRGLTQREFADLFHISQQSLYKYECGICLPPVLFLQEVSDFFDISIDSLVYTEEEHSPEIPVKLSTEEYAFISHYRQLPTKNKSFLLEVIEKLSLSTDFDMIKKSTFLKCVLF